MSSYSGKLDQGSLQIRVRNRKLILLFLNQAICCGYSKEPSPHVVGTQKNRLNKTVFEHQKHMFKLLDKTIIIFYGQTFCLSGPMKTCKIHIITRRQIIHKIKVPYRPDLPSFYYSWAGFLSETSCDFGSSYF